MWIYKDYDLTNRVLSKQKIDDNKHLMWKFGGVPCIDADNIWDTFKCQIDKIIITTKKGKVFETTKENFDTNKKEISFGNFGRQYYLLKENWN